MKKGTGLVVVGAILIIAAIGIYAISATNVGLKAMEIQAGSYKEINYNLSSGNYTFILKTSGPVHYSLYNSSSIILSGNTSENAVKNLKLVQDHYTLKIENLSNKTVALAIGIKSQESLMSLGLQVLGSGGVCLTGIIILAVGVWFVLRERRKNEDVPRSN